MRRGRLMHVEDMHARRGLRLVLARYEGGAPESFPEDLGLSMRERNGDTVLLEHRGAALRWRPGSAHSSIVDFAVGTDDLRMPRPLSRPRRDR